jgi:choline dehydrogenase-like flavoprotein
MLQDLEQTTPERPIEPTVCIIGAGPAGLTLARGLLAKGIDVALLEQGSSHAMVRANDPDVQFERREYRGATLGRAFGLGGTSSVWGGQLLPISSKDFAARTETVIPNWPIQLHEISRYLQEIETWLGVDSLSFDIGAARTLKHPVAKLQWLTFEPRFSKWIPFRHRNIANCMKRMFRENKNLTCWVNATASHWEVSEAQGPRRVVRIVARNSKGNILDIRPRYVVVAAGALESARILLEVQDQTACLTPSSSELIGRFLHDHLSVRIARVNVKDHKRFNELFAPIFSGQTMRTLKLELAGSAAWSRDLPSLYVHFVAESQDDSGFAVVRDILRGLQRGDVRTCVGALTRLPMAIPGIAEIAYWRIVRKRLVFPSKASVFVHVDFEQPPLRNNRLFLGKRIGRHNRRTVHFDWDLDCDPSGVADEITSMLHKFWAENELDRVAEIEFLAKPATADGWFKNLYDIYHPAGTTRMALSPVDGVVDPNLLAHGTENLFVLSTSAFPSLGSANPTFTLMALGLRLADRLAQLLTSGGTSRRSQATKP